MASRKWGWGIVICAVIAAAVAVGIAIVSNRQPPQPAFTAEQARELIRTKNVGLGYLENQSLPDALKSFDEIAALVPGDPLGPRNIAAARIVALGVELEPAAQPEIDAARTALAKMKEVEGETPALHWLGLRLAMAERDFAAASAHLDDLLKGEAPEAAAWYAKFRVLRTADPQRLDPQAAEAIQKALARSPANVWLLIEWLRTFAAEISHATGELPAGEAERAAAVAALKTRFAPLAEQLKTSRPATQAFAHVIQTHARVDVLALVDQAAAALEQGEFSVATARMRVLANVLLPHSASDQLPMRKHPLEFVLDRFRPQFYEQAGVAEIDQDPAIPVAFAAEGAWQLPPELQDEIGQVQDVALADFDLDDRLDIVALGTKGVAVWSRADNAQPWKQIATAQADGMSRLVVQDLDADFDETRSAARGPAADAATGAPQQIAPLKVRCPTADVDLVLYGAAGVMLLENRYVAAGGQRTLEPIDAAKLSTLEAAVQAVAVADLNADGDLDLALATPQGLRIWTNSSDWSFADASARSALPESLADAAQLLAFDWDRDVDIDVLVAAPSGGGWLENLRHGQFRWRAWAPEFQALTSCAAVEPIDADGNASWDVLFAGQSELRLMLTKMPTSGLVEPAGEQAVAPFTATSLLTCDYDNDGFEDLLAWSSAERKLFRGLAGGKFEEADVLKAAATGIRRAAAGDLDGDGDEDLAIVAADRLQLLTNDGGNKNHWIDVGLQAQQIKGQQLSPSGRVSPYGVGSLVELKAGARYQARVVRGQATHVGLGGRAEADVVRVGWLNGVPQNIIRPPRDTFVCEQQILNTSCPYLYAWDGERFVFVTDLLWNAPLGLQLAEGQLATWRDWEYLKIPGRQLAPKDGHYVLQVTAELWEADYFDEVKLIAVDHPAEVEVYSNEKVGPSEIAAFKIHTATRRRTPIAVRNDAGRDLLPDIVKEDGVYARTYERKLRQGMVEDHGFELDLGDVSSAQHITLYLTGWVFPASTSINVALSQGGNIAPPRPPSLEVADGSGGWKTVLPFMGFPGGKTKTIAIELSREQFASDTFKVQGSKFKVGEHSTLNFEHGTLNPVRLRISTGMELYWDHIFFTVDEPPAEVRTTELELVSADLHERGFSRVVRDESDGPEQFLYDDLSTQPKWPPMLGCFTRLGDVRELLTMRDDRLLVMGAGDEATLRFAAPAEPPPPGWKRDFLLYSVGWDKDANLETVLGQSSEPLPLAAMPSYPWPPEQKPSDSAEYREYLRSYQTRRQSRAYWDAVRQPHSGESHSRRVPVGPFR